MCVRESSTKHALSHHLVLSRARSLSHAQRERERARERERDRQTEREREREREIKKEKGRRRLSDGGRAAGYYLYSTGCKYMDNSVPF
jgi:predicted membrane metal-binding protein